MVNQKTEPSKADIDLLKFIARNIYCIPQTALPSRNDMQLSCVGLDLRSLNRVSPSFLFHIRYASFNNFWKKHYSKVNPQLLCSVDLTLQSVKQDLA